MDWFSWLSKTGLEPSLVYEYALAFTHNELEEDDMAYFNHEFLQSMGISIAKHRLEILKLARKEKKVSPNPMSRLILSIKRTKRRLSKFIRTWVRREDSALVLVPRRSYSASRWRGGAMLKRNKKAVKCHHHEGGRLLLTNGSPMGVMSGRRVSSFSSALMVHDLKSCNDQEKMDGGDDDDDDPYWLAGGEEIRWDTMFQDLKPT